MLRTNLSDLVGMNAPVIQAGMSTFTSPKLAAAVSNAGGLGSLGAWQRPAEQLRRDLDELRAATDRPFAVNHVVPDLDPSGFELTLEVAPAVVSFALDDARDLVKRVHDVGSLVMQQVTTVDQAVAAVEHGADIVVAQGGEAGGYGGSVATLALVPQVVDAVSPIPVVASGGIADGRGLAAVLVLGAAGVNLGTRFLACDESPVGDVWKKSIIGSSSQSWVQLDFLNDLRPNPGTIGYETRVRALRTEFTDRWQLRRDELRVDPRAALAEFAQAAAEGKLEEILVVGGQSAGLIDEILSVAEIVGMLVSQAEEALADASSVVS
ncbi:MAG TPA: nitronate monooxygenase [Acidimicrobiia bacterium]|jgi:nitronate monooxygenase/enoyl-[acyl-carrier protein] reductase II|nr:nitronate monooxygenase [Acidimicrobiia bacterium]